MPLISVVIVNYNVKYFIRQCLQSLFKSSIVNQLEVIIIDNNSKDGSVEMIKNVFPDVKLISNNQNPRRTEDGGTSERDGKGRAAEGQRATG